MILIFKSRSPKILLFFFFKFTEILHNFSFKIFLYIFSIDQLQPFSHHPPNTSSIMIKILMEKNSTHEIATFNFPTHVHTLTLSCVPSRHTLRFPLHLSFSPNHYFISLIEKYKLFQTSTRDSI
jgi:hypothetical protein